MRQESESTMQRDLASTTRIVGWLEFFPPLVPLLCGVLYLVPAVGLSFRGAIVMTFAGLLAIAGVGGWGLVRRREEREQVERTLSAIASAGRESMREGAAEEALRTVQSWPNTLHRVRLVSTLLWLAPMPWVLYLVGVDDLLGTEQMASFLLVTLGAAIFSAGIQYFMSRLTLRPIAAALAVNVTGRLAGAAPQNGHSTSVVVAFAVLFPVAFATLLTLDHAAHQTHRASEAEALRWSRLALDEIAAGDPDHSVAERIGIRSEAQGNWPVPVRVTAVRTKELDREAGTLFSPAFAAKLSDVLDRSNEEGQVVSREAAEVGSFLRVSRRQILVASVDRKDLPMANALGSAAAPFLLLGILAATVLWALLVSRDLRLALARLRDVAEQMAEGDLRTASVEDTQAELAEIARSLREARLSLGERLQRTDAAVGRALELVATTDAASTNLHKEAGDQTQRLATVSALVGGVGERVLSLGTAAEAMSETVDESSSSVAELGAASGELTQTASVLSSQIDEVSGSMEHMSQSVKKVGEVADRLAGASEDTSSSMEEMASAMRMIDTSAESMAGLSRGVVEKAEVGQEKVRQTIVGMEAIRDATDAAEHVIRGLGARTSEIGGILDVIEDVADETNLLALNAAIIAAQAGEHGKAFSVVAEQIKELADRVLASTKEIDGLIRSVQAESENAIGAIAAGSESVMSGVDLSAEAGRTLEEITDASRETGERIAEIVASVREQTTAAGHVVSLMERVRDSADEIHAASDEQSQGNEVIYRSSLTMRDVAQQVQRTTDEQAGGFERIRESIEGGRSQIEAIRGALGSQTGDCQQASAYLEEAFEGTRTHSQMTHSLGDATSELLERLKAIRDETNHFQTD